MVSTVSIHIMIMSGPHDGKELHLRRPIIQADGMLCQLVIGRLDTCDLVLPFDSSASREHAAIRIYQDGQCVLVDKESRNGTFIGRRRIQEPEPLKAGQLFRAGKTWLRIQSVEIS